MNIATISRAKNQLSALIDRVRHGESILIVDRDQPVARLEPVRPSDEGAAGSRWARLERRGVIRRGTGAPVASILEKAPPSPTGGGDVVAALLAEREDGR